MLDAYFKRSLSLTRLRSGPLGTFLDEFARASHDSGYADSTVRGHLRAAAHLGTWAPAQGLEVEQLDDRWLEKFSEHLPTCAGSWHIHGLQHYALWGARRFLQHLRQRNVVLTPITPSVNPAPSEVNDFEHWMVHHRGVTASTLSAYRWIVLQLVEALGTPDRFTAASIRGFVSDRAARHGDGKLVPPPEHLSPPDSSPLRPINEGCDTTPTKVSSRRDVASRYHACPGSVR